MMHATSIRSLALFIAFCATPLVTSAQQVQQTPPPQLEPLEEGEAPAITIRKGEGGDEGEGEGGPQITEKREGGRVTEIKVRSGNSTYYLNMNDQAGNAQPGDVQSASRPAQWRIKEFDLSLPEEVPAASSTEAPPPPPPK